jgi:hypothetical protein
VLSRQEQRDFGGVTGEFAINDLDFIIECKGLTKALPHRVRLIR